MCCRFNPEGGLLAVGLANGVTKVKELGLVPFKYLFVLVNVSIIFISVSMISPYLSSSVSLCLSLILWC